MYKNIEDYGIIGDMHAVALISKEGDIDYCCLPHIDSPTVFASLLDDEKGGYFSVKPKDKFSAKRQYLENTNILQTTFTTEKGSAVLTDLMPVATKDLYKKQEHKICRIIKGIDGEIELKIELLPRPNYARSVPVIEQRSNNFFLIRDGKENFSFLIEGKFSLEKRPDKLILTIKCSPGKETILTFSHGEKATESSKSLLLDTKKYWEEWLMQCGGGRCKIYGKYEKMIHRSLLVLKLLTFEPSGAIAAAATTSLPEAIGGERNWDYRFTWLRDSSFTLKAMFSVGHITETENFIHWLSGIYKKYGSKNLQIMYSLKGDAKLTERELNHLKGYKGSKPVRIGNSAYTQKQLDIYGEVMDTALRLSDYAGHIDEELWLFLRDICNLAAQEWKKPDAGIWEMRGTPSHFIYSKIMCWVALDRGIKIAKRYGFEGDIGLWKKTAEEIKGEVLDKGFNKGVNSFVQHYGSTALDSSLLVIPLVGFLPINDKMVQGTIEAIKKNLMRDGFLLRYDIEDGLKGEEGSFLFCNFWLVECLALSGKIDEAKDLMNKTVSAANELDLFSEEFDFKMSTMLGNFPQAFTHIGFINAVDTLLRIQYPKAVQEEKATLTKRMGKLLPTKIVLNKTSGPVRETSRFIAKELKETLTHLQGAFFDVASGRIDYDSMRSSEEYGKYLEQIKELKSFGLGSLKTDDEKKAFWINIYNIMTIHGVIDLGIKESVKEVFKFFRKISYDIGGFNFTPDDIEQGILRRNAAHPLLKLRQFGLFDKRNKLLPKKLDPRIHFALVCASGSCPPIEFFSPENINSQLDLAAKSFLNRNGAVLDEKKNTLHLSQIFLWFQKDFGRSEKDVVRFILPFLSDKGRKYISENLNGLKIKYLSYDWNLNKSIK